jgi:hypothetical protein
MRWATLLGMRRSPEGIILELMKIQFDEIWAFPHGKAIIACPSTSWTHFSYLDA